MLKSMKQKVAPSTPLGNSFHLPNYSGAEKYLSDDMAYCSLYIHEGNVTIPLTKDVYTHLTGWTQGLCKNMTQTTDEIVIATPGVYSINWSVSSKNASANQLIDIDLFVNGVSAEDGAVQRTYGTANTVGNVGATAILTLAVGDNVDLRAKNNTSDADILIFDANISVLKIAKG